MVDVKQWPASAKFAFGDRVRKHSGSWWEGRIVGFYSTAQTPIGYDIQMDMVPNGPTQIYPEAALEPAPEVVSGASIDPRIASDPCVGKLQPDEPFFVLLGRDAHGSHALADWITLRLRSEGRTAKVVAAEKTLDAFRDYQDALAAASEGTDNG